MICNNTFLWIKIIQGNYGKKIISISMDGLGGYFYESDSMSEYISRDSARHAWNDHAKKFGLK